MPSTPDIVKVGDGYARRSGDHSGMPAIQVRFHISLNIFESPSPKAQINWRQLSLPCAKISNVLATALANKLARIAWTVLAQGRSYEARVN